MPSGPRGTMRNNAACGPKALLTAQLKHAQGERLLACMGYLSQISTRRF